MLATIHRLNSTAIYSRITQEFRKPAKIAFYSIIILVSPSLRILDLEMEDRAAVKICFKITDRIMMSNWGPSKLQQATPIGRSNQLVSSTDHLPTSTKYPITGMPAIETALRLTMITSTKILINSLCQPSHTTSQPNIKITPQKMLFFNPETFAINSFTIQSKSWQLQMSPSI